MTPRSLFAKCALATMRCSYCLSRTARGDLPQPGWIGSDFKSDRDVVVILQNPGVAPLNYSNTREASVQRLLARFSTDPSEDNYAALADLMLADMAGENGGPAWAKWTHPVCKLVPDRRRLAWINVVKYRIAGTGKKDGPVTREAVEHGIHHHLPGEISALRPAAVITIGNEARAAISSLTLAPGIKRGHLKLQGASNEEVTRLRSELAL